MATAAARSRAGSASFCSGNQSGSTALTRKASVRPSTVAQIFGGANTLGVCQNSQASHSRAPLAVGVARSEPKVHEPVHSVYLGSLGALAVAMAVARGTLRLLTGHGERTAAQQ